MLPSIPARLKRTRRRVPPIHLIGLWLVIAAPLQAAIPLTDAGNRHKVSFSPLVQLDLRHFLEDSDGKGQMAARRIRPTFKGELGALRWRLTPELSADARIIDGWVELSPRPGGPFVRAGKFKGVIGLERLQSSAHLLFVERGLPAALSATRSTGLALHGSAAGGAAEWVLGAYDGVLDDAESGANLDADNVDAAARIAWQPWQPRQGHPLGGFSIGLAATVGTASNRIDNSDKHHRIRYRTSGRNSFFRYRDGVAVDGRRFHLNPFVSWYHGPFGLLAEAVRSGQEVRMGGIKRRFVADAWTLQASWVLTGEPASHGALKPANPVGKPDAMGAWELGLRWHGLRADRLAFAGDTADAWLAHAEATQKAESIGIALKWHLTDNLMLSANVERSRFSGAGVWRPDEEVLLSRLQVRF
jgi:phosphate-selective porin OprO and OprP